MRELNFCYVDTAFGNVSYRNNVMRVQDVNRGIPEDRKSCYATWHRFPKVYQEHCEKTGSVKGYRGPSYADFLPFDFDSDDLAVSLEKVRDFLRMLEVSYEVDGLCGVRVWFSGKKGFHVGLSSVLFGGWGPAVDLAEKLRILSKIVGQGFDLDSKIYDQNRMLRMQNTLHAESGLWKIPLSPMEVIVEPIETIQAWASQTRQVEWPDWYDVMPKAPLVQVWESIKKGQHRNEKKEQTGTIFTAGMRDGDGRDNQAFLIARFLRDNGLKPQAAVKVLEFWDGQQEEALGLETVQDKVRSAYSTLEGPEEKRVTVEALKRVSDLAAEYMAYVETLRARKICLGYTDVDKLLRGIAPGEVCTVIARTGVGKSAFLQNVLKHVAKTQPHVESVFCSMEQPLAQCFERWAQMTALLPGREIEEGWHDAVYRESILGVMFETFGDRVMTCGIPGLSLEELGDVVDCAEEKTGRKVNLLGLDYLGLMEMSDLDRTAYGQVSKAARMLKTFAKARDIALLVLCQVHRGSGEEESTPLTIHSARESGAIEESADFLLGLYVKEEKLAIQVLKNRKGQKGEFLLNFDRQSMRISQDSEMVGANWSGGPSLEALRI